MNPLALQAFAKYQGSAAWAVALKYIYVCVCVMYENMRKDDDHHSLSWSTQIKLFLHVLFASQLQVCFFASNPSR